MEGWRDGGMEEGWRDGEMEEDRCGLFHSFRAAINFRDLEVYVSKSKSPQISWVFSGQKLSE